MAMRLF